MRAANHFSAKELLWSKENSFLLSHGQNQAPLHGAQNQKELIQPYPKTGSACPARAVSGNEVISVTVQIILPNVKNVTNSPASANYDLPGLS